MYVLIDPKKCLACKSCEIQCALAHAKSKDLKQAIYEDPRSLPRVKVKFVKGAVLSSRCRHCADAPCIEICPTKAITRENSESAVIIDLEKCVGCKKCLTVCPFGSIKIVEKGKKKTALKCDLCFARLKKGEQPACVAACITGALQFEPGKSKKYLVCVIRTN